MCFVFGSLIYDDDSPRLCSCALGGEEPLACVCDDEAESIYIYIVVCVCVFATSHFLYFSPSSSSSTSFSICFSTASYK